MKKLVLLISLLSFVANCSSHYMIRPSSTLNDYKYVFIWPLQDDPYVTEMELTSLFSEEGFIVIQNYTIDGLPSEERKKVLVCKYSYSSTAISTEVHMRLDDYLTGQNVFSGKGRYGMGWDQRGDVKGALKKAFSGIKKSYSGFSQKDVQYTESENIEQTSPTEPQSVLGFSIYENLVIGVVNNNARKYGLQLGDKIIAINGQKVMHRDEVMKLIKNIPIGGETTLRVIRNNNELDIVAKTIDGKPYFDSIKRIEKYVKNEEWVKCTNEIRELIDKEGTCAYLACLESMCVTSLHALTQEQFTSYDGILAYECARLMIKESLYKPEGVEGARPLILNQIDWLQKNNFQLYANDIINILNDPSEAIEKAPTIQKEVVTRSTGTGFAISKDGLIVTACHLVQEASSIKIHLHDGSIVTATIRTRDPFNDLAILKIKAPTPTYLPIAPLRSTKTGDRVFTIGFPISTLLGQEAKYTEGVISSLSGIKGTASFFQITVPVQPGNSGGALVNEDGFVVGIVSASAAILPFLADTGTLPQNVNWAVKADYLRLLIDPPKPVSTEVNREGIINRTKNSTYLVEAAN